ncbi:hypothetical protein DRP43_02520, partial [candidate division TA06 bacterium]
MGILKIMAIGKIIGKYYHPHLNLLPADAKALADRPAYAEALAGRPSRARKKTTEGKIKHGKVMLFNFPSHWREGIEGRG